MLFQQNKIFLCSQSVFKSRFNFLFKFILCAVFLFLSNDTDATHISGADISYKWINGNTYEIKLALYRDCSGIAAPASVTVNYKSVSCSYNLNVILNKVSGTGTEITQPCPTSNTTCSNGSNPGVQKYDYVGNVTLPAQCSDWTFNYSICCRNCAITTLSYTPNNCSGVPATYVEATLNNLVAPNNSSPAFTNFPVTFFCIGQTFHYNHGAYDIDGDSLVYSFINPRSASGTDVVFSSGYSATSPISSTPPTTLGTDGDIFITPTATEVGVMAILVKEYRNGILIGTVVRDMEVWTQTCSNNLPTATGINGGNTYDIVACPGQPLSFTINSADADASQNVSMSWNNTIPGGIFTTSSASRPVGTFSWTPALSNARNQPYSFTVTVQDNNCPMNGFQTYSFNIIVPQLSISITSTNSNCFSSGTGIGTVLATGSSPFQYQWSNGAITSSVTGLTPGTYSVTVTESNGCSTTSSLVITSPTAINVAQSALTNVTCNGGSNGSISVIASGGSPPYTYSWFPSGGTGATAGGLAAGNYVVTVTDAQGCTKTMSASVSQPTVLTGTITSSNLLCNGNSNGFATINASGGTTPYSYAWSNGSSGMTTTGLAAGSYNVVVTDFRGCSITRTATINQPFPINVSLTSSPSLCGQPNGSATVTAGGGTGTLTFNWSQGGTSSTINNLAAGTYTVTVTDNNGCTKTSSVGVSNFTGPTINLTTIHHVKCFGGNNGSASVSLTGGHSPFTYSWSPSGGNSANATGLAAGNYIVSVTDGNNCTSTLAIQINQPSKINTTLTNTNPLCFSSNSGTATAICTGGTPPFNYSWTPGNLVSSSVSGLGIGTYIVKITDNNGCKDSTTFTLTEPSQLTANIHAISDVKCYGGNNGAAEIIASGGSPGYNYSWFPSGDTLNSAAGLTAGNYLVTLTDAHNCTVNIPVTINQPPLLSSSITTFSNVKCTGQNNGSASVDVNGGTAPYLFSWNPGGETGNSISNIVAGNYSVNITDANGCLTSSSIVITEPAPLAVNINLISNVSCNDGSDGSITVNVTGGTAPYIYQWNPGNSNSAVANNLSAGYYSILVTDANGCTATITATVTEPSPLSATINSVATSCFGGSDGSASVIASGGTLPYDYSWSDGSYSSNIGGLTAGNYSVIITDAKSCTFSVSTSVIEPTKINLVMTSTNSSCGNANGSATVVASGGTSPYYYIWNIPTSTTATLSNITAGAYSVTVEDENGCIANSSVGVSNNTAPVINTPVVTDVTCPGGNNGAVNITFTGGASPFTYSWSPSGGNLQNASSLSAGTYTITIRDKHHCLAVKSVTITDPPDFQLDVYSTAVKCNGGNDGNAWVQATGGTGTYNYFWNNGAVTDTITNVSAGIYSVKITDQKGCTSTSMTSVIQPQLLSANINNSIPVTCFGRSDGSATVAVSGGIPPYSYSWNPTGQSTPTASSLAAGNYSVTVTDNNGCTTIAAITITEPSEFISQTISLPGTCDDPNGVATVSLTGGTQPYSYLWNQTGDVTPSSTGLSPGSYMVTCTDLNGCQTISTAEVINTGKVYASLASSSNVLCNGGNDGSAFIDVTGGSTPYLFHWSQSSVTTSFSNSLQAGTYEVIVSDTNNCTADVSFTIAEPPVLSAIVTPTHVTCNGIANGAATVIATGGTGNLSYQWLPGGMNTSSVGSLEGGSYIVEVTDENSCSAVSTFIIDEPLPLSLSTTAVPAGCSLSNGSAKVKASGGSLPYDYSWNPGQTQNETLNGIPAGSYSIVVTDAHNCIAAEVVSVPNTVSPDLSLVSKKAVTCNNGSDGQAVIAVNSGTPPYIYNWFPSGGNATEAANLSSGTYSVTVRDSNNCTAALNIIVNEPSKLNTVLTPFDVSCFGGNNGQATSIVSGGTPPYQYQWSNGQTTSAANALTPGSYSLEIKDSAGCLSTFNIDISEPSPVQVNIITASVSCYNGNDGTAYVLANGGTPGYKYEWSNGASTSLTTDLTKGMMQLTVKDDNGCRVDTSVFIEQPPPVYFSAASTKVSCPGKSDGTAMSDASGGTPPYYYEWTPTGGNQENAYNLAEGEYTVTVHDINGCAEKTTVNVGAPPALISAVNSTPALCYSSSNGVASVHAAGGVTPYHFFWSSGSTDSIATGLHSGNYTVVITDNNGCTQQNSAIVTEPLPVQVIVENPPAICIGQNAALIAVGLGGTPGYNYTWSNGIQNSQQSVNPVTTTNYTVVALDKNNCISTPTFATVSVNPPLTVTVTKPDSICEGNIAYLTGIGSGGNGGPYNYSWGNAHGQTISVMPPVTQSYPVTVTDNCGTPSASSSVMVYVNPNPVVGILADTMNGCQPLLVNFKDNSNINSTDQYWTFGDGNSDTTQNPFHIYLNAGVYSVNHIVKSEHGCAGKAIIQSAVTVNPLPHAAFTNTPELASVFNPVIQFYDESVNGALWHWDFGDHSSSHGERNVSHTYSDTGQFITRLITISDKGCVDTAYNSVYIKGEYAFYIPNAFSPNNDGVNDIFTSLGIGVAEFDLSIFDRWGLKVFSGTDMKKGWNGRLQNTESLCAADVYVYKIRIVDLQNQTHEYSGHVTLIR